MSSVSVGMGKANEIFEGQVVLYRHMFGYIDSMCLKWCVEQRIPDLIHSHGRPITLHHLVSLLHVPPPKIPGVHRLMRHLAHNGFFHIVTIHEGEQQHDAYALTVASQLLVKGAANNTYPCLAPMVEYSLAPVVVTTLSNLTKWTCEGDRNLWEILWGAMDFWDLLSKDSAHLTYFNEAMASDSQMINMALRQNKSVFEGLQSIVDVGGGTGTTARIISSMLPDLKCIVFDLPQVVDNMQGSNNVSYVGGDMFNSIPEADALLHKHILHDWSDDMCIKILKKCRDAISSNCKGRKVIIIEMIIKENEDSKNVTQVKLHLDVVMTTFYNGKERKEKEWKKLFIEAGFRDYKILSLTGLLSLIEVYL